MSKVVNVEPKQGAKGTFWRIQFQPGGWHTAFDYDLSQQAKQALDSGAEVEFDAEQKGNFSNLRGIRLAQASEYSVTLGNPVQTGSNAQNSNGKGYGYQTNPIDAERMGKANALSTAFAFAGQAGEGEEYAFELAKRIYAAVVGTEEPEPPTTPDEVVEQVQQVLGGEVVQTGAKVKW